jgi:predicted RNA binding protein YcfA (HicA-like mRNA interferase family)
MAKVPVLKPHEVVKLLQALGFAEVRHADGRGTTVPFHRGQDISPVLLRKIARDIGVTVEDLLKAEK